MIKAISKVKKVAQRPAVQIDITAFTEEPCILEFKEPSAAALFPDADLLKQIKIKFPSYPDAMIYQVILLGKCYEIKPEDGESLNPILEFGQLAKDNKECFYFVLAEFLTSFPTNNLDQRVEDSKND